MKAIVKVEEEREFKYIIVNSHVRYWEDGYINRIPDNVDDPEMPCAKYIREFEEYRWCPIIDIDSGKILDWPEGVKASIHYKVCDEFECNLVNRYNESLIYYEGYVPRFMSPTEENYGDYIIMSIDEHGVIDGWNLDLVRKFIKDYNENI